jgi:hypothetical protein
VTETIYVDALPIKRIPIPSVKIRQAFDSDGPVRAARLAADFFLDDHLQYTYLRSLSVCLASSGEKEKALFVGAEAERLLHELRRRRIIRNRRSSQSYPEDKRLMLIWQNGLPADWQFDELLSLVATIAAAHN